jgi:hypothetical protein
MEFPQDLSESFRYSDIAVTILNNALVLGSIPLDFTQQADIPIAISTSLVPNTVGAFAGDVYTLLTNSNPSQGMATITANGLFTFTPITPMTSSVTITYKVCRASNAMTCSTNTIQINVVFTNYCPLETPDDTLWNYKLTNVGLAPITVANTFEGTGFPRLSNLGNNSSPPGYSTTPNVPKLNKIRWVVGSVTGVSGGVNWRIPAPVGATNQFLAITSSSSGSNTTPIEYRLTLRDSGGTGRVYSLGIIAPNDLIELEHAPIINSANINAGVKVKVNGTPITLGTDLTTSLGYNVTNSSLSFNDRRNIGCFLAVDSSWLMHVTNTQGQPTDLARQTLDGSVFPSVPFTTATTNNSGTLVLPTPSYATDRAEFGIRSGYGSGILFQWVPLTTAPFVATSYIIGNTLGIAYYNGSGFSLKSYTLPDLAGDWVIIKQVTGVPNVFKDNIQLTPDTSNVLNTSPTNYGFHWNKGLAYYRHK